MDSAIQKTTIHKKVKPLSLLVSRYIRRKKLTIGAIKHEQKFHNRLWERRLGIDTTGIIDSTITDGKRYEPTPYLMIEEILNRFNLTHNDVLVDLGCGKGRALAMAMRRPIKKIVGVEYDQDLLAIARSNIKKIGLRKRKSLKHQSEINLVHGLAQEFDYREATCIFLYNSFGEDTLEQVISAINLSIKKHPRRVQIAYINPQHNNIIERAGIFTQYETWETSLFPDFDVYPVQPIAVSFWQNMT